jgi:uncharacterized damage-inducible protein DinB
MNAILADLFRHNRWANLGLVDFCHQLPDDVLETSVPGTYGTIRETLAHIAGAEERYLTALTGTAERRNPSLEESRPDMVTLRQHLDQSGAGLIAYAESITGDPTLPVVWRGETHQAPASLFLVQAINHATEHRSQIMTAATQGGASPPELDGWSWDEVRRPDQS